MAEDSAVTSDFFTVMGMPTHVMKCGQLNPLSEKPTPAVKPRHLILIIPGNPGIIEYYQDYMTDLWRLSDGTIPVWGVSNAGHVSIPNSNNNLDLVQTSYQVCSLQGQIKHKITFIKEQVPVDVKLILIGHSIGCYMLLHMLAGLKDTHHVIKSFMLFPTIERMAESPKGQIATPLLKYLRWLGLGIVYILSYLSPHLQYRLILWYFRDRSVPGCIYNASMNLFDPFNVGNVIYMALQEMLTVKDLDTQLIQENLAKLSFYYGVEDYWCPQKYYRDIKAKFPQADVRLCEKGLDHAFIIESSFDMAKITWDWLQEHLHKLSD